MRSLATRLLVASRAASGLPGAGGANRGAGVPEERCHPGVILIARDRPVVADHIDRLGLAGRRGRPRPPGRRRRCGSG